MLDEAETRAKKSMNGIQQTSGKASKTSVKKFLTANPSEKTFLRIGSAEEHAFPTRTPDYAGQSTKHRQNGWSEFARNASTGQQIATQFFTQGHCAEE